MAIQLEDIGMEVCEPTGGLTPKMWFALHKDFQTIVDPKDICGTVTADTFEELVEIPAPGHTFIEGKFFHKASLVSETGAITTSLLGEKKRRLFQNSLAVTISGSDSQLLGFLRWIKNQDLVILVEEFGSGNMRQFGSKRLPAWVEGIESAIEAVIEGNNSVTITINDKQKWPASVYLGDVAEAPVPEPEPEG